MGKIALVFPGQGAQYVGMANDIYNNDDIARKVIDEAEKSIGVELKRIMFEGSDEELSKTENTQPAIVTHSIALFKSLKDKVNLKYDACLGLSLGEYSALVAADAIEFQDAVSVVKKRGKYMQESVPLGKGAMAAILGLDRDKVKKVIDEVNDGIVEVANYNSPGQIVISGEVDAIKNSINIFKENGAKRAVLLNVSAPFHSSMLEPAGVKLKKELDSIKLKKCNVSVVSNVNARFYKENYKDLLIEQVSSSVLWEDSIEKLIDEGFDTFIEIGPGKTLKGFIKKISSRKKSETNVYNIENMESMNEFIEIYKRGEI
ncbi:malonyl coa-acyl carrier protein transacylase [[Clostridium] sordellii]|uniref:Malonyl CoA-acyl carrier protein transacylase n=1 Tax=Paraclostridium sordellii TaxID=1505 RepID=A0ABM9RRT8_PARSO|nr:ACP S-malonyltransferase [Paeniclostridium sordellii]CEJ74786.1 Malonyl CoA-acyl carrier protein transacylase (MCT) [[Clostridium] sordellii] [Paeniclostridium sordellii]CEN70359.1 malonyl coa-acyl carrier protein transacylase [[Clostridium] sordellii] [Paeniclostridium sordellii]CEN73649.1 malonyl coa-acyl carrier protein transacylase [[Clostridium] sordellii] [Paeniclostridium sordellii]CEO27656.1 malonyl coa-acyl carrier protein transacylase [[Clostridium] sordellii] [Paeniclostridium sor